MDKILSSDQFSVTSGLRWLFVIPVIIFFVSRLLPFVLYGPHPLGYDTGFYEHALTQERAGALGVLQISDEESAGDRILMKSFIALGFSDGAILYLVYILVGFGTGV